MGGTKMLTASRSTLALMIACILVTGSPTTSAQDAGAPPRDQYAQKAQVKVDEARVRLREGADGSGVLALRLQLAKELRSLWSSHSRLASRGMREDDRVEQKVLDHHAKCAERTFAEALSILESIHGGQPDSPQAAEALYLTGLLNAEAGKYRECVVACLALLERYPTAKLPQLTSDRPQFNVYLRLGWAYSELNKRWETIDYYSRAMLWAAARGHRYGGFRDLRRFEPRVMSPECARLLPFQVQETLQEIRGQAGFTIRLAVNGPPYPFGNRRRVKFEVENRTDKDLRRFCLVFRILPRDWMVAGDDAWLKARRLSIRAGYSEPFNSADGTTIRGECLIRAPKVPGDYLLSAFLEDASGPVQRDPRPVPAIEWCEPMAFAAEAPQEAEK